MSNSYPNQKTIYLIGTSDTPATLTALGSGNTKTFEIGGMDMIVLYISYIVNPGSSDRTLSIELEYGPTSDEPFKTVVKETGTDGILTIKPRIEQIGGLTGGTEYKRRLVDPIADKYCRLSVYEDGSNDFGSITVQTTLSGI